MKVVAAACAACLCLASLLFATNARADAVKDCNAKDMDRRIKGCTSVLKTAKLDKTNKAIVYARRGDAYLGKRDYEAALSDFEACIVLNPNDGICRSSISVVHCHGAILRGADASGVEEHCTYLKTSTKKAQQAYYYNMLGLAYFATYKHGSGSADPSLGNSLAALNKAIAIGSEIGTATADDYSLRGMAYLQNKEPGQTISPDADKALQDFNTAISLDPSKASYYLYRGYAHNQLLNVEAAWADFQKAKELDPSDPAIQDAYEKQRQYSPDGQAELRKKMDEILGPPTNNGSATTPTPAP